MGPGAVASDLDENEAAAPATLAFVCQCLPQPTLIGAESVSLLARAAFDALLGDLQSHNGAWRLHVFTHPLENPPVSPRRCVLVENTMGELLHKRQRRLERTRVTTMMAPLRGDEAVAQLFVASSEVAYWSVTLPSQRSVVASLVNRFAGGVVAIDDDHRPPSRAYQKLLEMEACLGSRITEGETCVDLGGSPGGWTFIAADRLARVISVDRSPLRDDLMAHPLVTFVKGDAFAFAPEAPVDWLLCDVIAVPERSLQMLCTWLDAQRCRKFCVTLKFKGDVDIKLLQTAKTELNQRGVRFQLRQLASNKNEVSVFGACP